MALVVYSDVKFRLATHYMFYLSFENSLCDDYVTEKLWGWLKRDIVPVVMGQGISHI